LLIVDGGLQMLTLFKVYCRNEISIVANVNSLSARDLCGCRIPEFQVIEKAETMLRPRPFSKFSPSSFLKSASFALMVGLAPQAFAAVTASVTGVLPAQGIYPGEIATLRITLSNNDVAPVTNVAFSNSLPGTLPNGLKVAGAATSSCGGTFTANLDTQGLTLTNGGIPAAAGGVDGTCVIDVPVTAGTSTGAAASYGYQILSGAVTSSGGANSGNVSQTFAVRALQQPQISKNFTSSNLVLGGASTPLVITLTNPNPVAIADVGITDNFPTTIKVAAASNASTTCGGTFNPVAGAGSVTSSGGTLPANGSCTYTVSVDAAQTNGAFSSTQTNTINRTTGFSNDLGIPAQSNATDDVTVRSPLSVNKAFAHAQLSNGQTDSLTITLTNNGTAALPITSFTDSPIDGIGGASATSGLTINSVGNTCGGTTTAINTNKGVQLTGGSIPGNGGTCTVTVNFTGFVQTNGVPVTYTNNIAEGAVDVGNPAIHSQASSSNVLVFDDLRVLKSASPVSVSPGNPVRYQITVQNFGVGAVNNVVVTDSFTQGQTYLTGTINGFNYTPTVSGSCASLTSGSAVGATTPVFTINSVGGRTDVNTPGSCTLTMWAMASTTPVVSSGNVIPAGGVCYNSGATCNGGPSNNTTTTTNADVLTATKRFAESAPGVNTFAEGTIVRMTITLGNRSANPLTNVAISDTLQLDLNGGGGQLRIANPPNAATTCGAATITATAGATSVGINAGSVPARAGNGQGADGSCQLQVDVVGPDGVYPNTATVSGTQSFGDGTTQSLTPVTTNTATLTYTSALGATKNFNPSNVSSGGRSTVTIRLTNSSTLALTNAHVNDPLPTGMVIANPANAYTTCAGPTSVTATAGASSATLNGASIGAGGNCALLFDVIATGSANWTNTIPANTITADGGVRNVADVVGVLTFSAPNGLTVTKTTSISSLTFPGQVSRLTINVSNGTQAVSNLHFTDYFTVDGTVAAANNGWVLTPNPEPTTTCPGGIVTALPDGHQLSLSGANLAANAVCQVSANVTSTITGGNTNTIPPAALITDQGLSNASAATTSLAISTNVGIVKQFTPKVVKPGERSRLRITFYNALTQPISNLAVVDNLPAGVTIPADANPATTCAGGTVSSTATSVQISGGNINAAIGSTPATCQLEIDVLVATAGDYVNTIPANALTATAGGTPVTNTQPTTDTLRASMPLTVHKAFSSRTLDAGNPAGFTTGFDTKTPGTAAVFTIRIDNPNAVAITGAAVTDTLPSGLVIGNTPAATTTCAGGVVTAAPAGTSMRLTGATIPANGFCIASVNVLSNIPGTYNNTINAGDITTNEGVTNEEPTNARLIVSNPPTIAKQFAPAVIPPNGVSRLTIVINNDNASTMTLQSNFDDILPTAPGQISVSATPNVVTNCGGTVVAAAGATSVRLNNGGTIPAGGCTINVNVTGVAAGVHTNNIPAGALVTDLGNNPAPANATLTISTQGFISGKVFKDNNVTPNGTFETGTDTPIVATTIELRNGATCAGALLATTTTDTLGNYIFSALTAGAYSVCEPTQPTGTANGITTAGTINGINGSTGTAGVASNPTTTTSQIANIVLNANGAGGEISGSSNNNFAEVASSSISGKVFKDNNAVPNGIFDGGGDDPLANVTIQLLNAANVVVATTVTDANGNYSFDGLQPGTYSVLEPTQPSGTSNGITTAGAVGNGGTPGVATTQAVTPSRISTIVLPPNTSSSGNNFAEEPRVGATGVVYDSVTRQPVAGAVATINGPAGFNAVTDVVGGSASSTTGPDGLYQFLLNPSAPAGTYTLVVTTYPASYLPSPSTMIPVCSGTLQVAANPDLAAIQNGTGAPASAIPLQTPTSCPLTSGSISASDRATSQYYFSFNLSNAAGPTRSGNVANNHIPLDPILGGAIVMTKTTPLVNVVRSDLVPYSISATNTLSGALTGINIVDTIPSGFRYRTGTASLNGVHIEPVIVGRTLTWLNQNFAAKERKSLRMMLVVGTGVSEGEYVNQVAARNAIANTQVSNTATATVRVVPDPTFDCSDIIGKVFDDKNANGYQDQGEPGIANVRIATPRGLLVTSDHDGRFHVACAEIPNEARGSNFVMKVDERTLPTGYRMTTENPRDVRVTRGKMTKLNFGATVHRVIRVELSGAAFTDNSVALQPSYQAEFEKLPEQLQARPSVLRIAYRRGAESSDLVNKRVAAVRKRIEDMWHKKRRNDENGDTVPVNPLLIETEIEVAQ
jgi:uncharacterized repeat protein (TIGR01451 family)